MRIGSLFSGYGGLTMGVQAVVDGTLAWTCDPDPGPAAVLAHHHPDIPNLGDITAVDWSSVEPVDVIEGGSPCQDVSAAGRRAGMRAGTRSGLWASMCDAVDIIRPRLVVWENVKGALSAAADSDVEPCPVCVGDAREVHLRALGRVLGDLADLGYDASWCVVRASDVGAPHHRARVFVAAWPAADPDGIGVDRAGVHRPGQRGWPEPAHRSLTPANSGDAGRPDLALSGAATADAHGDGLPRVAELHSLAVTGPARMGSERHVDGLGVEARGPERPATDWGAYGPAITRWERVLRRRAPAPTEPGRTGAPRLSAPFVEWLMGLPVGWVTDVPGVTRNDQLKLLGNGVVPQQAAMALQLIGVGGRVMEVAS